MITVRLFVEGKGRHPVKAWRISNNPDGGTKSSWQQAKEVTDYLTLNPPEADVKVQIEKISTGQGYIQEISRQEIMDNIHIANGPILQIVRQAIERVEEAPDLVQERINKGALN